MRLTNIALLSSLAIGGGLVAAGQYDTHQSSERVDTRVERTPDSWAGKTEQFGSGLTPMNPFPMDLRTDPDPMRYFVRELGEFAERGGGSAEATANFVTAQGIAHRLVAEGTIDRNDEQYVVGVAQAQKLTTKPGALGTAAREVVNQAGYIESDPGTYFNITAAQESNALATLTLDPSYVPFTSMTERGAAGRFNATLNYYEHHGNGPLTEYLLTLESSPGAHSPSTRRDTLLAALSSPAFRDQVVGDNDAAGAEMYLAAERARVSVHP